MRHSGRTGVELMGIFQERVQRTEKHLIAISLTRTWIEEFKIDYNYAEDKDAIVKRWFF